MPRVPGGPVNIITMASTSPQYMWVSSSSGVRYVDVSNGGFRQVDSLDTPGLPPISTQDLDLVLNHKFDSVEQIEAAIRDRWGGVTWKRLSNGVYGAVDKDNELYYVTQNAEVLKFKLKEDGNPAAGVEVEKRYDFAPYLGKGMTTLGIPESIVGVSMTYDGHLLVQSNRSLSVLDRDLGDPPIQQIRFGDDETVSNSIAVDDKNGIYVASDKLMRKVVWTGSKLSTDESDGAWSSPYDFGRQSPAVKFGIGTGSTPTLMGFGKDSDELVVITDGADRMKLVAFWRNKIPDGFQQKPGAKSNRIADQIQVTAGLKEPGIVFLNGYTKADGWEVTGLDWKTGETVHRTIFGQSNLGSGAYTLIEGLPNGDLLFNSVGGPFRAKNAG